jgi:hypothetical protein
VHETTYGLDRVYVSKNVNMGTGNAEPIYRNAMALYPHTQPFPVDITILGKFYKKLTVVAPMRKMIGISRQQVVG